MTSTLKWRSYPIASAGVTIDVVDGSDVSDASVETQHYVLQKHGTVQLGIRIGKTMTLAWWRDNFGSRKLPFTSEVPVSVCGRPSKRQEVAVPEERATGSFKGNDGNIGHMEHHVGPRVSVAIEGTTASGTPFVAIWSIDASERDARRTDEDHFFASISC
jgi:hypothetical protein